MTAQPAPTAAPTIRRPPVIWSSFSARDVFFGERRLDGEAFLTGGYAIRRAIEGTKRFTWMGDLAKVWMPGRLKGIKVEASHGLPFLTATQVLDIRPTARKWLAPGHTADLENRFIKPGWILVTCSGNVGESIVSYTPHVGPIVSHDLLRVQVEAERMVGYVYAFLRTSYGRAMLRSSQYGSIIKHLEPEHMTGIPVPEAEEGLRREVSAKIKAAFDARERAFSATQRAEEMYAEGIGVEPDEPAEETGYSVPGAIVKCCG